MNEREIIKQYEIDKELKKIVERKNKGWCLSITTGLYGEDLEFITSDYIVGLIEKDLRKRDLVDFD